MTNHETKKVVLVAGLSGIIGCAAGLFGAFWSGAGKAIFDRTVLALPPDWAGILILFLALATAAGVITSAWLWVTREHGALDGCDLVEEGGYYVDRKLGHAICPKCAVENGQRVGMMSLGVTYSCRVCSQSYKKKGASR